MWKHRDTRVSFTYMYVGYVIFILRDFIYLPYRTVGILFFIDYFLSLPLSSAYVVISDRHQFFKIHITIVANLWSKYVIKLRRYRTGVLRKRTLLDDCSKRWFISICWQHDDVILVKMTKAAVLIWTIISYVHGNQ